MTTVTPTTVTSLGQVLRAEAELSIHRRSMETGHHNVCVQWIGFTVIEHTASATYAGLVDAIDAAYRRLEDMIVIQYIRLGRAIRHASPGDAPEQPQET